MDGNFVNVGGLETRFFEKGEGEPIVLIHGGHFGLYYSAYSWNLNWPFLSKSFHVYAFDRLGMGYTDNPVSNEDHTMSATISHAERFLDRLDLGEVSLIGHSRGAFVAASLALRRPKSIKSLIVIDTNTLSPYDPNFDAGRTFYSKVGLKDGEGETRETVKREAIANSYSTVHITDDFVDEMYEIATLPKTRTIKLKMESLYDRVFFPELERSKIEITRAIKNGELKVPTLILWGMNDPSAPVRRGWELFDNVSRHASRCQFHVFNCAGHYSFREHPDEFNEIVTNFIKYT